MNAFLEQTLNEEGNADENIPMFSRTAVDPKTEKPIYIYIYPCKNHVRHCSTFGGQNTRQFITFLASIFVLIRSSNLNWKLKSILGTFCFVFFWHWALIDSLRSNWLTLAPLGRPFGFRKPVCQHQAEITFVQYLLRPSQCFGLVQQSDSPCPLQLLAAQGKPREATN